MSSTVFEEARGPYRISTDKQLLEIPFIHRFLSHEAAWAQGIPRHVVERSIQNLLCFGIYEEARQVRFARVITDYSTLTDLVDWLAWALLSPGARCLGAPRSSRGAECVASAHEEPDGGPSAPSVTKGHND